MPSHSKMNCPVCDVPLVVSARQGVQTDSCPKCRGVWLDSDELDEIISRSINAIPATALSRQYERRPPFVPPRTA